MDNQNREMMARFDKEAHSFVIRIWRENREVAEATAEWRGWIKHTQSGQRHYFRDVDEIRHVVASYLDDTPDIDRNVDLMSEEQEQT